MQSFKMALESLAANAQEVEGLNSTLSVIEKDEAFAAITAHYDEALQTVISLEAFEKIVNAGVTHNKKEFEPNQGLGGQLVHGLLQAIGLTGFAALGVLAIEEYDALPYEKKLAYVQEGISEWVARIWNAIRSFLTRVWNWIKSLFTSKNEKKKQLEAQAKKRALIEEIRRDRDKLLAAVKARTSKGLTAINAIGDELVMLNGKEKWKLKDPESKEGKRIREKINSLRKAVTDHTSLAGVATENNDSIADSLIMVLDEIANLKPHYQSGLGYYLLNTDAIKEGVGSKEDMFKALDYTKKSIVNVNNYISRYLIDPAKEASRILSQPTFDEDKALDILKKMIPSARELNSRLGNIGDVIENQVVLPDFVGTEGLSFHCTSKDIETVFKESVSVGDVLAEIGFYRGSRINFPAEKPLVELCMTQQCVERSEKAGIDIFLAYEDMIDIATKYDSVINELQKSIEKVSRNEETAGNRQAMNFAKLVMHCLASYLNQPLGYFNVVVPRIMDALIDHTKNSNLCADPESVFSKL